eukprot:gene1162-1733_t
MSTCGLTPLHEAAKKGDLQAISDLIQGGHDVNVKDGEGDTPLHVAAAHGQAKAVERLRSFGASAKALNNENESAYDIAKEHFNPEELIQLSYELLGACLDRACSRRRPEAEEDPPFSGVVCGYDNMPFLIRLAACLVGVAGGAGLAEYSRWDVVEYHAGEGSAASGRLEGASVIVLLPSCSEDSVMLESRLPQAAQALPFSFWSVQDAPQQNVAKEKMSRSVSSPCSAGGSLSVRRSAWAAGMEQVLKATWQSPGCSAKDCAQAVEMLASASGAHHPVSAQPRPFARAPIKVLLLALRLSAGACLEACHQGMARKLAFIGPACRADTSWELRHIAAIDPASAVQVEVLLREAVHKPQHRYMPASYMSSQKNVPGWQQRTHRRDPPRGTEAHPLALSQCRLWRDQRSFYAQHSASAWTSGKVPYHISSNSRTATAYANVALAFYDDARASAAAARGCRECDLSWSQEVHYVIEVESMGSDWVRVGGAQLGSGHGKLGFHLAHLIRQRMSCRERMNALSVSQRMNALSESQRMKALSVSQRMNALSGSQRMNALSGSQRMKALSVSQRMKALSGSQRMKALSVSQRMNALSGGMLGVLVGDADLPQELLSLQPPVPGAGLRAFHFPQLTPRPGCFTLPVDFTLLERCLKTSLQASTMSTRGFDSEFRVLFACCSAPGERRCGETHLFASSAALDRRFVRSDGDGSWWTTDGRLAFDRSLTRLSPLHCASLWEAALALRAPGHLQAGQLLACLRIAEFDFECFMKCRWALSQAMRRSSQLDVSKQALDVGLWGMNWVSLGPYE